MYKEKLSDRISLAVQKYANPNGGDIVMANFFVGMYEMDVFRLLSSGYLWEYEIKISREDYFNDFKKVGKHNKIKEGSLKCNRFFFVVPRGLITKEEVPDYVGLLYFNDSLDKNTLGWIEVVKNAPLLHKNKVDNDFYKEIAIKLAYREQNYRFKIRKLKRKIK